MNTHKFHSGLDQEQLKQIVRYDPETGQFFWLRNRGKARAGNIAGSIGKRLGYRSICINHLNYLAHRLAWLYVHGRWPSMYIDHIDGNPSNNAIANLREADQFQNQQNTRHIGVAKKADGKFESAIKDRGRLIYLGRFTTPEDARAAYLTAKREYHGEFCPAKMGAI